MYKKQSPKGKPINYFSVESICEFLAKIIKMAGKIIQTKEEVPGVGWIVAAEDPEGNQFALIQPMRI